MCDGDKSLVIKDRLITRIAKRNMKDIVPLAYELKKAKGGLLTPQSIYDGMAAAYTGGNIGIVSNKITQVWNQNEVTEEQLNVIKWLVMKNNQVIDYAKTLWLSQPPPHVQEIISRNVKEKLPNFFIYAKDKQPHQVEPPNNSTMNRISAKIPTSKLRYCKTIDKLDWRILINQNVGFTLTKDNKIIRSYDYWNRHQYLFNTKDDIYLKQEDLYMYQQIRLNIISETQESLDHIVNSLVVYFYTLRQTSNKKLLWACFGDVILANIKRNLADSKTIICPICGKRFVPERFNQKYCSEGCSKIARNESVRINMDKMRHK